MDKIKAKVIEIMESEGLDTSNKALVNEMIVIYQVQTAIIKRAIKEVRI